MTGRQEEAALIWMEHCPRCGVFLNDHPMPNVSDEQLDEIVMHIINENSSTGVHEDYLSAESFRRGLDIAHP